MFCIFVLIGLVDDYVLCEGLYHNLIASGEERHEDGGIC